MRSRDMPSFVLLSNIYWSGVCREGPASVPCSGCRMSNLLRGIGLWRQLSSDDLNPLQMRRLTYASCPTNAGHDGRKVCRGAGPLLSPSLGTVYGIVTLTHAVECRPWLHLAIVPLPSRLCFPIVKKVTGWWFSSARMRAQLN
jgi:hypothetical protein